MMKLWAVLFVLPASIEAFSSIAVPPPSMAPGSRNGGVIAESSALSTVSTAPWRITLNIGREPLSSMPFDWARSGCRMPLVIPCDFHLDQNKVEPLSDIVSFTAESGAVIRPVSGGNWKLTDNKDLLSFTLHFPKTIQRRDVTIDAGTTITLETKVYSKQELKRLNEEFYEAREASWQIGGELNEIARNNQGPKKWNEAKRRWETRRDGTPLLSQLSKRMSLLTAQAKQQQKNNQRPNPKTLSTGSGLFPSIPDGDSIFVQKEGVVKIARGGGMLGGDAVIGTWSAEPINDKPVSYYR